MPPKKPPPKKTPKKQASKQNPPPPPPKQPQKEDKSPIDLSPVPIPLQQLLLNTFKSALLPTIHPATNPPEDQEHQDLKSRIQTLKSHLYNRDFASAFTDAEEAALSAYALRWSAARALGYVGVFRGVVKFLLGLDCLPREGKRGRVVCVGGGAGAEIVALAAVWRDLFHQCQGQSGGGNQSESERQKGIEEGVRDVSLDETGGIDEEWPNADIDVDVTAVDIADWSSVVHRLSAAIRSPDVPALRSCPAPLLPGSGTRTGTGTGTEGEGRRVGGEVKVDFKRADVLNLSEEEFKGLFPGPGTGGANTSEPQSTVLVTLMFTLNELFSTSMAKATGFLLRLTDSLQAGTVLLVVDSPGSYSTLKLGGQGSSKGKEGEDTAITEQPRKERQYPMKFLLDHTLLSVAKGKWEKVLSQDSRWWRREAARLSYDVGEGAGLEDMRFQLHVYRRLDG